MTDKEITLSVMRTMGAADAQAFSNRIINENLDGTIIIDHEEKIPLFNSTKDYSSYKAGFCVAEIINGERYIFGLLQPYNAAHHEGTPNTLRALWSLKHTKNPLKARSYIAPYGTSGLYMKDECCLNKAGAVVISKVDNNAYSFEDYPANWTLWEG